VSMVKRYGSKPSDDPHDWSPDCRATCTQWVAASAYDALASLSVTELERNTRLHARIRELEAALRECVPPGIEECCDECGEVDSECPPTCYLRVARALVGSPLSDEAKP